MYCTFNILGKHLIASNPLFRPLPKISPLPSAVKVVERRENSSIMFTIVNVMEPKKVLEKCGGDNKTVVDS
jgi:hypothetical protein